MATREQREARDQAELLRREKQLAKPDYKLYLLVLCIVVVLIHIVDEIATNTPGMVESNAVKQFFPNLDLSTGKAAMVAITTPLSSITMLAPFYKALADKFGRSGSGEEKALEFNALLVEEKVKAIISANITMIVSKVTPFFFDGLADFLFIILISEILRFEYGIPVLKNLFADRKFQLLSMAEMGKHILLT